MFNCHCWFDTVKSDMPWFVLLLAAACLALLLPACAQSPGRAPVLGDYPRLFQEDTLIVVSGNASSVEMESATAIASQLKDVAGYEPVITTDANTSLEDREGHNLVLIGLPGSNDVLGEVCEVSTAQRVTQAYPGKNKGILEILRNPWNSEKIVLVDASTDTWGLKAGSLMLEDGRQPKGQPSVVVDWEEYTDVVFPIDSEEEAVRYAETDSDVRHLVKKWSIQQFDWNCGATLNPASDLWEVRISPISEAGTVLDFWFLVRFTPDGTIVNKGIVQTS